MLENCEDAFRITGIRANVPFQFVGCLGACLNYDQKIGNGQISALPLFWNMVDRERAIIKRVRVRQGEGSKERADRLENSLTLCLSYAVKNGYIQ